MASNKECVFCELIRTGSRDAQKLYEDERVYAMLDDFPINKGHALVILKKHKKDIIELSSTEAKSLAAVCLKLAKAIKKGLNPEMVYIAFLCETVTHAHYHLIPRYRNDRKGPSLFLKRRKNLSKKRQLVKKITQFL